jgi:glycosyltransferase involved in cell wall biosynthesis
MSILVVTHNITQGGAATACRRLIAAFKNHKLDVEVLSVKEGRNQQFFTGKLFRTYNTLLSLLDISICKVLNNGSINWKSSGFMGSLTARQINRLNPSIVNVHWIGHATISIRQLQKLDIPIIVTMHDEWWLNALNHYEVSSEYHEKSILKNLIIKNILNQKKKFLSRPNVQIVCPSSDMKLRLNDFLPNNKSRVQVIPNPVSTQVFFPPAESEPSKKVLLFAGGINDSRKGYDLLMDSLKSMKESCEVVVLGKKTVEMAGLSNQIKVVGHDWVNSEHEMNRLYGESSMTIVPSRQEAFGQVASESAMAGTPVACFEVGGLVDIVQNGLNGYLIQKFDTKKMAETLDSFLRSNTFNRENISTDAKNRFSEESVVKCYMSIL